MSSLKISSALAAAFLSTSTLAQPLVTTAPLQQIASRSSIRAMNERLSATPTLLPMGIYIGDLQELWRFPSDHLPIGMNYRGIEIGSWNVLDAEYMDWVIEKNSQGLSRSMIADTHVYIGDSKLTVRDKIIASNVLEMINHPTHPRCILSLQECSNPFLQELATKLPAHIKVIAHHGNAVLIDESQFKIITADEVFSVFSENKKRSFQVVQIEHLITGETIRIINAHLPGDPNGSGRYEFAHYLAETANDSFTTIAMGDMNFNELEMRDALGRQPTEVPYTIHSPYCTNIDPTTRFSKAIDHFIVFDPEQTEVICSDPEELLQNLNSTVQLLSDHG